MERTSNVRAAPFDPGEYGRNSKYALSRLAGTATFAEGWEEAEKILGSLFTRFRQSKQQCRPHDFKALPLPFRLAIFPVEPSYARVKHKDFAQPHRLIVRLPQK